MTPSQWLPWIPIMLGIMAIPFLDGKRRLVAGALIASGYVAALPLGQLSPLFAISVLLLVAAGGLVRGRRTWMLVAGHALFLITAIALRLHVAPGFQNPLALSGQVSALAGDFKMYLNLDKTLPALWILWFCGWIDVTKQPVMALGRGASIGLMGFAAAAAIGVGLGAVAMEPKTPAYWWVWALNNLLLVCFAEEVFFRGYIQGGLQKLLKNQLEGHAAVVLSIAAGAVLFALAHFGTGPKMMALTAIAGAFYGWAYWRVGLVAAITAHFTLNALHFFLLTYPSIAA